MLPDWGRNATPGIFRKVSHLRAYDDMPPQVQTAAVQVSQVDGLQTITVYAQAGRSMSHCQHISVEILLNM